MMSENTIADRGEGISGGRVADQVHQMMLDAIVDGDLLAGDALHDHVWAEALGVSRTPVREAIQRLHGLGLLDVAPARYTRLCAFSPNSAHREAQDWATLHHSVVASVNPVVSDELVEELHAVREAVATKADDRNGFQSGSFGFFRTLRTASPSYSLRLGATAAAYRLRLADSTLPHVPHHSIQLHSDVVTAIASNDAGHAHHAFTTWTARHDPAAGPGAVP